MIIANLANTAGRQYSVQFTLQEVIDLLHQMEVEYKTIFERETAYTKEHLFLSSSQKAKLSES